MKKIFLLLSGTALLLGTVVSVQAVPVLQVGVEDGLGGYVPYETDGADEQTAFTTGTSLVVAGSYARQNQNDKTTLLIGGQYTDPAGSGTPDIPAGMKGLNWSDFGFAEVFNSHRALLVATARGIDAQNTLKIDLGQGLINPFYTTTLYESGFIVPNPPSNHYPIREANSTYMFFDIGDFANISNMVPDLSAPGTLFPGEIKDITFEVSGFSSVHFDLFALVTKEELDNSGGNPSTRTYFAWTDDAGNPGSHDVTWEDGNGGGGGDPVVPEPGTLLLLGVGLAALGGWQKFRK